MATKKLDKTGLSQVWSKIVANFVAKESGKSLITDELIEKLSGMNADGEANKIDKISVNGVECEITDKGISLTIPKGKLADLDEVGQDNLSSALTAIIAGKAEKATTLSGYGIADAYTKDEADAAISTVVGQKVAGVYKIKGSVSFTDLPASGNAEGDVYNITDDFTADSTFVEAEQGKTYPIGTNVVYTASGWDAMAGVYDLSGYMLKADLTDITEEEINEICVMPTL